MLIFLHGQDTYRMRDKLMEIINHYKDVHKKGLNLEKFNCLKEDGSVFDKIKNGIIQHSIFKETKFLLIANLFSNQKIKENLLKEKNALLSFKGAILFYEEGAVKKNDLFFKFLEKNAKCQEFKPLTGLKLKDWVRKKIKERKVEINNDALDLLCLSVGSDSWKMSNEIAKLSTFKIRGTISLEDVKKLIKPNKGIDIFKTIDAIAKNNKKMALELLSSHLEKGDSPSYILSMIDYQFRNLLMVKDLIERRFPYNIIQKKTGLHSFVVQKSYHLASQFSLEQLKKIHQRILQADLDIKTGQIDSGTALDLLIVSI